MASIQNTTRLARCGLLLTLLVLGVSSLRAQDEGSETGESLPGPVTRTYAIRNARIVQAPGRVIERGTVIVRDGLITAVGTNIPIPFDARVIEGDSLTVYAGFIDGLSHAGVPKPKEEKPADVKRPGDPPNDRAGIQPDRDVRSLLKGDDASIDSMRMAGFTAAHVVPRGQMLPGSGAIVLLSGSAPNEMVLRGNASMYAQFTPALDDVYPATPMAIMAKFRQLYREAARRGKASDVYREQPAGMERPRYDVALDAFSPVIDGKKPVVFRAESDLEVRRAIKLSRELDFPLMIAGLKEGWSVASELKSANIPLFVSLDLPKEKKSEHRDSTGKTDVDSARIAARDTAHAVTPPAPNSFFVDDRRTLTYEDVLGEKTRLEMRQRDMRRRYHGAAAELQKAGVRFGFASAGASPGALRENLRLAIQSGLTEDAALAALTVDAARLLGLDNVMGTVERGKMANLTVTTGPVFKKGSHVRYVFVDGEMFSYEHGSEAADTAPAVADTGRVWRENTELTERLRTTRGSILVKNGTVLTITQGTLENTDVLIENGKIARVGKGLQAPRGAETIDATGQFVMPGIIDAHSHIAVSGPVNEWTNPVTAEVAIGDVLDPYDIGIYRALAGGVTISHVMHGSANVIGGQCRTIKHRYGVMDPELIAMENAPRTIKFALGENPTRVHGRDNGIAPSTRMGVETVMRKAFTEAQRYMTAQERYEKERKSNPRAVPPQYDLRLETLAEILRGNIIINCHSYRADEILMTMRVLKDFGIDRVTFQHVNEGFKVAPELAKFGATASVFSDWWSYKFEVYYSTAYNAAILTRNGVVTSINSDSPELNRHLYHEAAKTIRYGALTKDEALALITINPAKQIGIEGRAGSIEVGKDGDLAIFNAHPLSIYAICQKTIVDGVLRFDREKDPDDMRVVVDPVKSVETATIYNDDEERCMQGTEHLFHGK